jgi:hypothetical protein
LSATNSDFPSSRGLGCCISLLSSCFGSSAFQISFGCGGFEKENTVAEESFVIAWLNEGAGSATSSFAGLTSSGSSMVTLILSFDLAFAAR